MGDPAGCGANVIVGAIARLKNKNNIHIVGDIAILKRIKLFDKIRKHITVIDLRTKGIMKVKPGYPTVFTGKVTIDYIDNALEFLRVEKITRLVTAPICKEAVAGTIANFTGHTEYLAANFAVKFPVMMMVSPKARIVLLTRHINLNQISANLNVRELGAQLQIVYQVLTKKFKIKNPKIAIASVNPHAGVNTFMRSEEKTLLKVVNKFKLKFKIDGPLPADTLFTPLNLKKYDCILCSYHDQGMIPFKLLSFYDGVNLTCGLPIIRTSPAHGTAFDLIKNGIIPDCRSMLAAINLAQGI